MEEEMLRLIKEENDQGMKLLMDNYGGLIYYIVGNIIEDKEEVEECINDIYMKVWKNIHSYSSDKSKFTTWLTVISRNTALNYYKKFKKTEEDLGENFIDDHSPEKEVLKKERLSLLGQAIQTLSPEERHIFYRKYYYLQKTAQIAAELGKTERSIEGILYRLRKKLQIKLGGDFR